MKLNEKQTRQAKMTMDCYITDGIMDALEHPSYEACKSRLLSEKVGETEAARLWIMLIDGFRSMYGHKNLSGFEKFAQEAADKGLLSTGSKQLALWSGGFDMSIIAQEMGYCTLEATVIGKILNEIPITSLWDVEKHLWNTISQKFVEGYTQNVAHIYFQTVDDASVLNRQELPQLGRLDRAGGLRLHPIYLTNRYSHQLLDKYAEVGLDGRAINIHPKNSGIPVKENAWTKLQEMLRTRPYRDVQKAVEAANNEFFDPKRAPFAQDK